MSQERLDRLKEEYKKVVKKREGLLEFSRSHTVVNLKQKLDDLTKHENELLQLINDLEAQLTHERVHYNIQEEQRERMRDIRQIVAQRQRENIERQNLEQVEQVVRPKKIH